MVGPFHFDSPNIHPLRGRKDLAAVADLIEICFAESMDPDGRDYLRNLRRYAKSSASVPLKNRVLDRSTMPVQGFIWEEDGEIVGNLTLIPYFRPGCRYMMVANVAVLPAYRRKGIARKLTQTALDYTRTHGAASTWLHVRNDNLSAQNLYRSLGFVERSRRTTWQLEKEGLDSQAFPSENVSVTSRRPRDWHQQETWLDGIYPKDVAWNLPIEKKRLKPSLHNYFKSIFYGKQAEHLSCYQEGQLIGTVSWEPTHLYSDFLWIATDSKFEEIAIRALLPAMKKKLKEMEEEAARLKALQVSAPAHASHATP